MAEPVRILLWTGGDAPSRDSELTVEVGYDNHFHAYWEPGYCGCEDCRMIVGEGDTEADAIADYWSHWETKYG
jgi:hypothetical protein